MAKDYTVYVPAGNTLEMVTDALSIGYYQQLANPGNDPIPSVDLAGSADVTIGPFSDPRNYYIHLTQGDSVVLTQVANASIASGIPALQTDDANTVHIDDADASGYGFVDDNDALGTSDTVIPTQGNVKSYTDTGLALKVSKPGSPSTLASLANDADGTAIAAAVNAINTILIAAGMAVAP